MYKQQGRSYFLKLVVFLQKTKHHTTSMPPSAPLGFRRATRPSHHCKALHALLFPLPPKGIRKPNQNVKTRKLTDRRSLVWSHCVSFQTFFGLKMLCLEESSQLKLCDSGHGMSCKAALPNPMVCRKQGDVNIWFTNLLVRKENKTNKQSKKKNRGGKRKKLQIIPQTKAKVKRNKKIKPSKLFLKNSFR